MYDLSILIPSRNEMFTALTVENILKNKRGKTEVLIGLDGKWASPGIPDHDDVRIIYVSESIGQRAMTNQLARLSTAKYVAKTDAHVAFDEGFDVKMLEAIAGHDNWTMAPTMFNLWGFDWKCLKCGARWYQGPTPKHCMVHEQPGKNGSHVIENSNCDNTTDFIRKMVWKPNPQRSAARSYRFDKTLHFQYFREFNKRPEGQGDVTPSMSLQGSFFMMTRAKYWELDICDEAHGSWGQQGTEVACKTWLSGGEVMINNKTWYSHLFRTQGGDFTFPYRQSQEQIDHSRRYSKQLFMDGKWDKAIHPLSWLIEKFAPVPDWEDVKPSKELEPPKIFNHNGKGIIYYTDNQLNLKIAKAVQKQLKSIGLPIVSTSLKPMSDMGKNIHIPLPRGKLTMFQQILAALEASNADTVFFCEHDVLYHPSHFEFNPPKRDKFYYNLNVWRVRADGKAVTWDANQVAELCCDRKFAVEYYKNRIKEIEEKGFNRSYEPGGRDKQLYENWRSEFPNIDIRHDNNLSKSKWSPEDFRDKSTGLNWQETTVDKIPGWVNILKLLE